jgi:hypothetical protein
LIASSNDSFRPNCSNLFIKYFKLGAKVMIISGIY